MAAVKKILIYILSFAVAAFMVWRWNMVGFICACLFMVIPLSELKRED